MQNLVEETGDVLGQAMPKLWSLERFIDIKENRRIASRLPLDHLMDSVDLYLAIYPNI